MVVDIEGIKASLRGHAEAFDDLLRLIPPKFYLSEEQEQSTNSRYLKNVKKETELNKKEAQRKGRANAKAARLDPDNYKTVQEMQASKLEKQIADKLKIADSPKKSAPKTNGKAVTEDSNDEDHDMDSNDEYEDASEDVGMGGSFDLDGTNDKAAQTSQPAEIKPMPASSSIGELRQRLKERIDNLRQKRKAPEDDVSREALLQKRISRRKKSDEAKAKAKKAGKSAQEQVLGSKTPSMVSDTKGSGKSGDAGDIKNDIYFGKLTTGASKKKNVHVRQQLAKIESKNKELDELRKTDSEKADRIEAKDKWSKALNQAKGEKVKDDVKLLRKTVKRMDQQKAKSSREWTERKNQLETKMKERALKRDANVKARVDAKKMRKEGKSKKAISRVLKGGKSGGIAKGKSKTNGSSKARPGFEGGKKTGTKKSTK
ncbi:hypothetical protein GGI15_001969 [Coemansia interrupta]|uniref:SURF6-domain-containing protein n=1 Tax=Coemansia interrupta TaxID=1126814 RepID=A0A9W8HHS9_9FUNG|nr:hypothetical protein GGI15_001969 [Coemansia interrupta]